MEIIRTGLRLKEALDNVNNLPSIGTCYSFVKISREEDGACPSSEEDDPDEQYGEELIKARALQHQLHQTQRTLYRDYHIDTSDEIFKNYHLRITKPGCEFIGSLSDLNPDLFEYWYKHAEISGFGDQDKLATVIDEKVRKAREIQELEVDNDLLSQVVQCWQQHFYPTDVYAEVYKLNLYGPGGHFEAHRDTPAKNLVGTFLLGLGDSSNIRFSIGDRGTWFKADLGSWCAFYPSVVHQVEAGTKGYRATLAFKIYYRETTTQSSWSEEDMASTKNLIASQIFERFPRPFGIIFRYKYSLETTTLSGWDSVVMNAIQKLGGVRTELIPIVTCIHQQCMYDCQPEATVEIYPFTEAHIRYILGETKETPRNYPRMPFYTLRKKSDIFPIRWSKSGESYAEHVGNESRPGDQNSIYLHYALLVMDE